jgi:hypothetical protein
MRSSPFRTRRIVASRTLAVFQDSRSTREAPNISVAIVRYPPGEVGVEGTQTGTQTIPLLARKIRQGSPLAIMNQAPEPYSCFGALIDMRVKWHERQEWEAIELVSFHPKPMFVRPILQNNVAAVGTVTQHRSAKPISPRIDVPLLKLKILRGARE